MKRTFVACLAAVVLVLMSASLGNASALLSRSGAAQATPCPGMLPPRLVVGQPGRVISGTPANVREQPDVSTPLLGQIPDGGVFTVIDGPRCSTSFTWWQVDYQGLVGWTIEVRGATYLLERPSKEATTTAEAGTPSPEPGLETPAQAPTESAANPSGKIAFVSTRDGYRAIYTMNADGTDLVRLTGRSNNTLPAWSPDGTQLAFVSTRDGNEEIYVMDADGSDQRRLTKNAVLDTNPTWSSDGQQIAFISNQTGRLQLWTMNADGSNRAQFGNINATSVAWSPDGQTIVFTALTKGVSEIYAMNADGSNSRLLSRAPAYRPAWSPDGKQIAFYSSRDGLGGITVMTADGGRVRAVAQVNSRGVDPTWSPDSRYIAFTAAGKIYVQEIGGPEPVVLVSSRGENSQPAWSRGNGHVELNQPAG